MSSLLIALVHTISYEADGVISVVLRPWKGSKFPPFSAGSHIDLHLANGLVRSYSLLNDCQDAECYVVGILKDKSSRGGSRYLHEQLRVGTTIEISAPRNNFELEENAQHSVLIAGGIGVTPLLSMAKRLKQLGRSFEFLYFARSKDSAAFIAEIKQLSVPVYWHFDDERGGPPNLRNLLSGRADSPHTHFYACGPTVMLDAFEDTCKELGIRTSHVERFSAVKQAAATDALKSYKVLLQRSGRIVQVTPEVSLLNALRNANCSIQTSCEEGICGSCETRVLNGDPDHRDSVLSADERVRNKTMMICVSGCKSELLTLDL